MSLPMSMYDIHLWYDFHRICTDNPWNPYPNSTEEIKIPHRSWWEYRLAEFLWYKLEDGHKAHYEYIGMMVDWKGKLPI